MFFFCDGNHPAIISSSICTFYRQLLLLFVDCCVNWDIFCCSIYVLFDRAWTFSQRLCDGKKSRMYLGRVTFCCWGVVNKFGMALCGMF